MSITPDMLSRPPGDGEVFCSIHGIGVFLDGACAACVELAKQETTIGCPEHGLQQKNEAGACPLCGPRGPAPPKVFDPPPDVAPQGVSPKPGFERPPAKTPRRVDPKPETT
jgi:hypothetical protein